MPKGDYHVVEYTGWDKQQSVATFKNLGDAIAWKKKMYSEDELDIFSPENMDVVIMQEMHDGTLTTEY